MDTSLTLLKRTWQELVEIKKERDELKAEVAHWKERAETYLYDQDLYRKERDALQDQLHKAEEHYIFLQKQIVQLQARLDECEDSLKGCRLALRTKCESWDELKIKLDIAVDVLGSLKQGKHDGCMCGLIAEETLKKIKGE